MDTTAETYFTHCIFQNYSGFRNLNKYFLLDSENKRNKSSVITCENVGNKNIIGWQTRNLCIILFN